MRDQILIPAVFRRRRKERNLTLAGLAELAGVSVSFIKLLEAGVCQPSDPYAETLARALDCTVEDFSVPKRDVA
jgi:transcriptional regulator with XRE-family HTH domain